MSLRTKALLAIVIAAFLWATAGVVAKTMFHYVHPFVAASHRFLLASAIILPLFLKEKKPKRYIQHLLPLGLLNAGNVLFYFFGLSFTSANTASILGTAVPLTTTLLAAYVIKEKITSSRMVGIFIGLIGATLIVILPLMNQRQTPSGNIVGNFFLLGSLVCWTGYIVYSRFILSSGAYSPIVSTAINIFTVAVSATIASLLTRQNLFPTGIFNPRYFAIVLYASIFITILTFFLFQWAMTHVSASTASLKEYVQLVVSVGMNAVFLGERLTASYVLGSALVITGVFLVTGQRLSHKITSAIRNQGE